MVATRDVLQSLRGCRSQAVDRPLQGICSIPICNRNERYRQRWAGGQLSTARSRGRKASAPLSRPSLDFGGTASVTHVPFRQVQCVMDEPSSLAANWGYPTSIRFGAGQHSRELPEACHELGSRAARLLVTDPGLAALSMVADAVAACEEAGLGWAVFSDVLGNPVEANSFVDAVACPPGRMTTTESSPSGAGSTWTPGRRSRSWLASPTPAGTSSNARTGGPASIEAETDGAGALLSPPPLAPARRPAARPPSPTPASEHVKRMIFHPAMVPSPRDPATGS